MGKGKGKTWWMTFSKKKSKFKNSKALKKRIASQNGNMYHQARRLKNKWCYKDFLERWGYYDNGVKYPKHWTIEMIESHLRGEIPDERIS